MINILIEAGANLNITLSSSIIFKALSQRKNVKAMNLLCLGSKFNSKYDYYIITFSIYKDMEYYSFMEMFLLRGQLEPYKKWLKYFLKSVKKNEKKTQTPHIRSYEQQRLVDMLEYVYGDFGELYS
jgi:hypothetical protein